MKNEIRYEQLKRPDPDYGFYRDCNYTSLYGSCLRSCRLATKKSAGSTTGFAAVFYLGVFAVLKAPVNFPGFFLWPFPEKCCVYPIIPRNRDLFFPWRKTKPLLCGYFPFSDEYDLFSKACCLFFIHQWVLCTRFFECCQPFIAGAALAAGAFSTLVTGPGH